MILISSPNARPNKIIILLVMSSLHLALTIVCLISIFVSYRFLLRSKRRKAFLSSQQRLNFVMIHRTGLTQVATCKNLKELHIGAKMKLRANTIPKGSECNLKFYTTNLSKDCIQEQQSDSGTNSLILLSRHRTERRLFVLQDKTAIINGTVGFLNCIVTKTYRLTKYARQSLQSSMTTLIQHLSPELRRVFIRNHTLIPRSKKENVAGRRKMLNRISHLLGPGNGAFFMRRNNTAWNTEILKIILQS